MSGIIYVNQGTKISHERFISWLNRLLNDYVSSFYDNAIKNIIALSFIKEHYSFMQEMYQSEGHTLSHFLTVLPTDTTNYIMMIHNVGSGVPIMYNSTDCHNFFEFDGLGRLIRFYENVTVDLYDNDDNVNFQCYVGFEDFFGIKCPMFYVKNKHNNQILSKGLLDILFDGKYSGSYLVKNTPLNEVTTYKVTNITKVSITADIPILTDLNIRYVIEPEQSILIPITDWTDYFFRQGKELDGLKIQKM